MSLDRGQPSRRRVDSSLSAAGRRDLRESCRRRDLRKSEPAVISYGTGRCDLAQHRDFWDEVNKLYVCGFNPQWPADDTVSRPDYRHAGARFCGTLVNYACHPTTLAWENRLISPDYPGAMREVIEGETGGAPCIFLQGASGELGPQGRLRGGRRMSPTATAGNSAMRLSAPCKGLAPPLTRFEYQGPVISGATLGDWRHKPISPERERRNSYVAAMHEVLPIPYRPDLPTREGTQELLAKYSADEEIARKSGDSHALRDAHAMVERQTRLLHRLAQLPPGKTYPFDLHVWRMGDAVFVAVPGEHYSYLQTHLRARFPGRILLVITLAGGWGPSYLPTRETYGKGLYQESIAVLAPGSLELIADELARRIAALLD